MIVVMGYSYFNHTPTYRLLIETLLLNSFQITLLEISNCTLVYPIRHGPAQISAVFSYYYVHTLKHFKAQNALGLLQHALRQSIALGNIV